MQDLIFSWKLQPPLELKFRFVSPESPWSLMDTQQNNNRTVMVIRVLSINEAYGSWWPCPNCYGVATNFCSPRIWQGSVCEVLIDYKLMHVWFDHSLANVSLWKYISLQRYAYKFLYMILLKTKENALNLEGSWMQNVYKSENSNN